MDTSDNLLQPSAEVAESVGLATEPPSHEHPKGLTHRVKTVLNGKSDLAGPSVFQRLSLVAFMAWIGLAADGSWSYCYESSRLFHALGEHQSLTNLAAFLTLVTTATVLILSAYAGRVIEESPTGGRGYLIALKH